MKTLKNTRILKSLFISAMLFSCSFTLFLPTLQATIWRVNNRANMAADFTSVQAAIDAAASGDTIYIGGSETPYTNITVNKPVILVGPGFLLDKNLHTQVYKEAALIDSISIITAGVNSTLAGLSTSKTIAIASASGINIQKCHFPEIAISNGTNIIIEQSLITSTGIFITSGTDIMIRNNLIYSLGFDGAISAYPIDPPFVINNITVQNNVIRGAILTQHTHFVNNIMFSVFYQGLGDTAAHNISDSDQFDTATGNLQNVDMTTVFTNYTPNQAFNLLEDNHFQLAANAPAIGAGAGGGDCGMFSADSGGVSYTLSGIPYVSIYELTVPETAAGKLNINLKSITHP